MKPEDMQLGRIDLNLLHAFNVLMEEQNVSRAAERLFITQPAMSNKLQRLREIFDDSLFVRHSHGLTPTPKAKQLIGPVGNALNQLASTIFDKPFDPSQSSEKINLQIPDSLSISFLPALYQQLCKIAPKIKLHTDNVTSSHLEHLAKGTADFSIYIAEDYGEDFIAYDMGCSTGSCWMRRNHPLSHKESVSFEEILTYPLAELSVVDAPKNPSNSFARRIQVLMHSYHPEHMAMISSSQLLTLITIVLSTDTLLLAGPSLSTFHPLSENLINKPIQEFVDVTVPLVLLQHRRTQGSPLHTWLAAQILRMAENDQSFQDNHPHE